jgi:CheY-like chemotaxis protein
MQVARPRAIHPALRWLLAPASVALAHFGNQLAPLGKFEAPFFITAVMVTAHFSGIGPASLAFVCAGFALDYFYLEPIYQFAIQSELLPSLFQFIVPTALGCWFIDQRARVQRLLVREAELGRRLQGEQSVERIGEATLRYLAPELGAPLASFYALDDDQRLRRRASFAFSGEDAPESFGLGEGLIGQAALTKEPYVTDLPPDYTVVRSSLGAGRPRQLLLMPAADSERVQAVLELGFAKPVSEETRELLRRIAEPLALSVRAASYRDKLRDLLEETRRQAEELRAHEEQLRSANEELNERGRTMAETHTLLEEQQAELEQTNQTLREQTRLLSEQNEEVAMAHQVARERGLDAEKANLAKSEFLANMSHELRTPLNSSLILAKLLMENREGNLSPEQLRFAETIHGAGTDLLTMIDEILDLSKIEAGKVDLHVEDIELAQLERDLRRTFEPVAHERRLHFELLRAADVPARLLTDAQRLSQILKNLLSNAFKFTERGQVSLLVSRKGDRLAFAVRDTGIGIPESQWSAIFDAFQQADGTTNRRYGGTGLGLTISRDLARLLGGDLELTSVPEQGSTFTLLLPLAAPIAPATASPAPSRVELPAPRPEPITQSGTRRRSILIIEDDLSFARIVADLAAELDFTATIASSAEEALALATKRAPDGIVLDMNLPDHSGLSVLDRLKRDSRTRHVPVHVISVADYTRAALEMGAVGYALKPLEREQIKAALRRLERKFSPALRRLLVVEDDPTQRDAISELLGGNDVEIVAVGSVAEALAELSRGELDCVVTDLTLPDGTGYDLLSTMAQTEAYSFPSVVVYTGRSLTREEEQRLRQYSSSIIVKGARSPERLLDEVTLFLHRVEAQLPPERQRMLRKARHREAIFEERKVLVVEDDVRNIFALSSVLEPRGMQVIIARNGREALEALEREQSIDVVLMDTMMPEMDGLEATRRIRSDQRWPKLPIIALTAKAMKDDQLRCLEAGANEYLPKPLDVDLLLSLLRVWLPP